MQYRTDIEYRDGKLSKRTDAGGRKELPAFEMPTAVHPGFIETIAQETGLEGDTTLKAVSEAMGSWRNTLERLTAIRDSQNPAVTQAAHLNTFARMADSETARICNTHDRIKAAINARIDALEADAEKALVADRGNASEIRTALRSMSEEDRGQAIREAIEAGDGEVIHAVKTGTPITSGITREMQGHYYQTALNTHAPDILKTRNALESARGRMTDAMLGVIEGQDALTASDVRAEYAKQTAAADAAREALGQVS